MKPRILDFGARPELSGTFSKMLAKMYWPADAFRITFPSSPGLNAEVNVFERLILRLLEQGTTRSEEALACETCLDKDFVRTVVRQLQDKGLLDASLRPDVESLQKLGLVTGQNGFETYATAIVFRERLGGQILPYIHVVSDSTPLRNAEYQDAEAINLWKFSEKRVSRPPKRSEIRVLLRSLSERARLRGTDMPQPSVGLVNVESRPETVLLQCSLMLMPEDFGRHVVTNPFGAGYSALLGDVLIQSRSKFLELNQVLKSIESRFSRGGGDGKKSSEDRVPIETRERYPRVADALRYDFLTAANVYDALEWALFYASCHAPIDDVLFMVEDAFRRDDLPKRLFDSALRTEFVLDRGDGRPIQFAPIRPGKILDFRAGKAEMNTVLAISIFQAAIHPDQAPFAKLARTMPDFFQKIQRLRQERNAQRHGGKRSGARRDTAEADWVIAAIQTLLPDVVIRTGLAVSKEHTRGFHNRIAHRMRLQARFGFSMFSRLTETQIANLVVAAQNAALDNADRQPFATGVCAALESFLKNRIQSTDIRSNLFGDEFEEVLSERAKKLGLSDFLSRPCFNLQTRNRKSAAAGNPASLGACILCFIAREDEDILRMLTDRNPRWLKTVADLLDLRGHGNEARPLPRSSITQIRDEFLSLFQTLMETLPCHYH